MATTIEQQVALDEALVPSTKRLRIGRRNFRLPSDIQSKKSTMQVVYDVLRRSPFFKAFLVTTDVLEIYMQKFWATTYVHQHSIRFKMDTRKNIVGLEAFREMLHISPRVLGQSFDELPFEEEILDFLRKRGGSDSSTTPPTAVASPRPITTVDAAPRLTAATKGKQPARATSPTDPSENSFDDEDVDDQDKGRDDNEGKRKKKVLIQSLELLKTVRMMQRDDDDDDQDEAEKVNDDDDDKEEKSKINEQEATESGEGDDEDTESDEVSEEEETREEEKESFDLIPRTPENSEDEGNGKEDQGLRISEEERMQEEEEADELYHDIDINQGRGLQYIFESLVRNVDSTSKFYMYPRVGKGFSGVETPFFENMLAIRAVDAEEEVQVLAQDDVVQEHVIEEIATEVVLPTPTSPSPSSPIVKLKARVKKLEMINKVKSSKLRHLKKVGTSQRIKSSDEVENVFNQGRISVDMDQDEGIEIVVDQEKGAEIEGKHRDKQAEIYNIDLDHSLKVLSMQEDTEVQEAVEVVTTAKLITEVVTAVATQVVAASTPISAAKPKVLKIAAAPAVSIRKRKRVVIRDPEEELHIDTPGETPTVKDKGKGILIKDPKPMKKKNQVEIDAEYAKKLQEELNKEHEEAYKKIDWNDAFDYVQAKKTQYIKRYHGLKKKPQSESEARKNMISYLKNTEGYKMEFFKGKTYDQILPNFQARFDANMKFLFKTREEMEKEDEEIIKSINETPAQKAAKRRKLSEEAQEADDLKKRLEIIQDKDDDVFVEATPLAQKVPVVDYQVVVIDNKPRYKIIRADDTHQFYISFTTLLKNFDREDLETLWKIVKDRFSTKKPTNFSDEYLLLTLKTMFRELDEHDAIWRNQKSVHGLALVKR
nr:hypothetical protein [Tanacetum cinerariifolium]